MQGSGVELSLAKIHILSCFMAIDITQHLQPESFTLPLSILWNKMSLNASKSLYLSAEKIMWVTVLKAWIDVKLKHSKSKVQFVGSRWTCFPLLSEIEESKYLKNLGRTGIHPSFLRACWSITYREIHKL